MIKPASPALAGRIPIFFTGGVAKNPCMVKLLSEKLNRKIRVSPDPQMNGAYGAALLSAENHKDGPKTGGF